MKTVLLLPVLCLFTGAKFKPLRVKQQTVVSVTNGAAMVKPAPVPCPNDLQSSKGNTSSKSGNNRETDLKYAMLRVGDSLSDIPMTDIRDRKITFSQFKGKYLLLDFWASWCRPCIAAMPHVKEVYDKYHNKGFDVMAISLDLSWSDWEKTIKRWRIEKWHHVMMEEVVANYFEQVREIPAQYLIDPSGKVVWSSFEESATTWEKILKENLKTKRK